MKQTMFVINNCTPLSAFLRDSEQNCVRRWQRIVRIKELISDNSNKIK